MDVRQRRYCSPIHTNRERYSAIDMVMRTTADDVGPIASVVLSTREVRTHIRGNKGQLRDTRHHCFGLTQNFKGSPTYVAT